MADHCALTLVLSNCHCDVALGVLDPTVDVDHPPAASIQQLSEEI